MSEGQRVYDEMRREEGRKEGLQEAVKNLMRTANVSEQEARRLLCLDSDSTVQRSSGAKKMNLN